LSSSPTVDPQFEERVRESFARQQFMAHLGARLSVVAAGYCEIELPWMEALGQQHGFFHAGAITSIADNAGGYAAYSLLPAGSSMLSVELKINLLRPAEGELLVAQGAVLRSGKQLSVCRSDVYIVKEGQRTLCAACQMTLMALSGRSELPLSPR
jgi:uncharacterized protein (TIGR00369 family)